MKLQDLHQPYRALAEMRREQQINSEWVKQYEKEFKEINDLNFAFYWENTPEGDDWWNYLNEGSTPEIPAASLDELKEWQKEHPEYEATVISEQPNDKLFQAAVAAMQGLLSNSILAGVMKTFNGLPHKDEIAEAAFTYAEALINEGKKRGHL